MSLKEAGWDGMDQTRLAQDRGQVVGRTSGFLD